MTTLEALENIKTLFVGSSIDLSYQLNIIESALKDYEKLKNEYDKLESIYTHFIKQYNLLMADHSRLLRTFVIIKEKKIDIYQLILHLLRFNSPVGYNAMVGRKRELTQEEFDLLKEVLL